MSGTRIYDSRGCNRLGSSRVFANIHAKKDTGKPPSSVQVGSCYWGRNISAPSVHDSPGMVGSIYIVVINYTWGITG
jgi:hypothetical protein